MHDTNCIMSDSQQVLVQLKDFETLPGIKPFAGLKQSDVDLINYHTTLFDTKLLPGSITTDTEVRNHWPDGIRRAGYSPELLEGLVPGSGDPSRPCPLQG